MKVLSTEDYNDFACVGDQCPITCCGGSWMIIVDEDTEKLYRNVDGEFGERLKNGMLKQDGNTIFRLSDKGECIFLDEHKLCDIYKHLGPDKMCNVCKSYPRRIDMIGDIAFCHMTNSCPEVTRRIMQRTEPLQVILGETDQISNPKETDWQAFNYAVRAFTTGMDLLQNRSIKVNERVALLLVFVNQFQAVMKAKGDPTGLVTVFSNPEIYGGILRDLPFWQRDCGSKMKAFLAVFRCLLSMSRDYPMWKNCRDLAADLVQEQNLDYDDLKNAFARLDADEIQIETEEVLSYRFFVVFMKGFRDSDYYDRIIYECILHAALQSYVVFTEVVQKHVCTKEERILFYSLCSRTDHVQSRKEELINEIRKEKMAELDYMLKLLS